MRVRSSSIPAKLIVSGILLNLFAFYAVGQTEDSTRFFLSKTNIFTNLTPYPLTSIIGNTELNKKILFTPNSNQQNRFSANDWLLSKPKAKNQKIKFEQNATENIFPNLGQSNQFSGDMKYELSDKVKIDLGMGLFQQNTILSPWDINYQFGVTSSIEYSFNSWLSAYIYGQYISPSLNQKDFFDPLQYMNPLFKQTEFGGGVRAKYKSIKADVGMRNIRGADLNEKRSTSYFQSKISLGF